MSGALGCVTQRSPMIERGLGSNGSLKCWGALLLLHRRSAALSYVHRRATLRAGDRRRCRSRSGPARTAAFTWPEAPTVLDPR
jgi:hypothetical protein